MADDLISAGFDPDAIKREIDDFVSRTSLSRLEAAAAVLRSHGLHVSDLEPTRPLTEEEERRLGVNRSLLDDLDHIASLRSSRVAS